MTKFRFQHGVDTSDASSDGEALDHVLNLIGSDLRGLDHDIDERKVWGDETLGYEVEGTVYIDTGALVDRVALGAIETAVQSKTGDELGEPFIVDAADSTVSISFKVYTEDKEDAEAIVRDQFGFGSITTTDWIGENKWEVGVHIPSPVVGGWVQQGAMEDAAGVTSLEFFRIVR